MPPKSTLPVRESGSSPAMLGIFPGMAKHMLSFACCLLRVAKRRSDLAEGDAAIIGWDALMPKRIKVFFAKPTNQTLCEIAALKASTRYRDLLFADSFRNLNHAFH